MAKAKKTTEDTVLCADFFSWQDEEDPFFDYSIDYFRGSKRAFIGKTINYPFSPSESLDKSPARDLIAATITHSSGVKEHLIQWDDFIKYLILFSSSSAVSTGENVVKRAIQHLRGNWGENNRGKGCIPEIPIGLFVFLIDENNLDELAKKASEIEVLCDLMGHFGLSGTELVYYRKGDGFAQLEWKELHPFIDEVV